MPQPTTQWIKDSGVVINNDAGYLVDELGNFLVDENGLFLLDSISTNGNPLAHEWENIEKPTSQWADSNEARTTLAVRVTAQGDTRVTAQGDTRVANVSPTNRQPNTSWVEEYA